MSSDSGTRGARSFAIDTLVVAVTQLVLRVRGLVLLPLLVQRLGTAAYGEWAQVLAFSAFLGALVSLNLHLPLVREIAADRARSASVYTTLLVATIVLGGAVSLLLAANPEPIAVALLDSRDAAGFVRLGLMLMVFNNVRLLGVSLYRATGRFAVRSFVEVGTTFGEILGIVVLVVQGHALHDVLVFMVVWNGAAAVLQSVHGFVIAGVAKPEWPIVASACAYGVPLIPASFANFALDRMDRFVVGHHLGAEGVGIYSANYAIGALVMIAQAPFQMTLFPKVAELWDRDRVEAGHYIEASFTLFATLAIPFVVGVPLLAPAALTILGNAEIGRQAGVPTFFIAAGVALWGVANIHSQVLHADRRTKAWGASTIAGAAINLVLNLVLVPRIGVSGAAIATFVSYAAIVLATAVLSRPILKVRYAIRHLVACSVASCAVAAWLLVVHPVDALSLTGVVFGSVGIYVPALFVARHVLRARDDDAGGFRLFSKMLRR